MIHRWWYRSLATATAVLALAMPRLSAAQQITYTIRGTVVEAETRSPLPGASVQIRGTQLGALTDGNGVFVIQARLGRGNYTLDISFIGRRSVAQPVDLATEPAIQVNPVALERDPVALETIVVTGTAGPTAKKALGNSVSVVRTDQLDPVPATTVDAALSGRVAGAQVVENTGEPGGGVSVRLRGTSSITGGAEPLYIVDGVIVDNNSDQNINFGYRSNPSNRLADLDPSDIDHIEILKGAAAAALYGSRANNGVVQIFTKHGTPGRPVITVQTRVAREDLAHRISFALTPVDASGNPTTRYDNQDLVFRNAVSTDTHVSLSGGTEDTRYYVAGSYSDQQGIMKGSDYQKINARMNLDQNIGSRLRITGGANYVHSTNDLLVNGENGTGGILTSIVFTPTDVDLTAKDPETGQYKNLAFVFPNPLAVLQDWRAPQTVSRFIGSFGARATPTNALSFEYRFGYDTYGMSTSHYIPRGAMGSGVDGRGLSAAVTRDQYLINNDLTGNISYPVGDNLLFNTAVGMNHTYTNAGTVSASATDLSLLTELVRGAVQAASESKVETTTLGFFGQQQLTWKDRLYLTGALRWDASSTFGPSERWQLYPKVSASYVLSEEPFFQNAFGFLQSFRLRGALGYAGNQPPTDAAYSRFPRYTQTTNIDRLGLVHLSDAGNLNLKPERQREIEAGFDASLLNDRLGVTFTYYNQHVTDLLLPRPFATSTGYSQILDNVGVLSNKGVELQINTTNLTGWLGWNTTFNFGHNSNEVQKLASGPFSAGYNNRVAEGEPLGEFYLRDFARDANGNIMKDANGTPLVSDTLGYYGSPMPSVTASLLNEFKFGSRLSVSMLLDGSFGQKVWNQTRRIMDRFSAGPAYDQELRGEITHDQLLAGYSASASYLENGSFVKIRDLTLRYQIPEQFLRGIGIRSAQLELGGHNLYTFTDYTGYDPEINMFGTSTVARGVDFAVYPIPRSISLGVRVTN